MNSQRRSIRLKDYDYRQSGAYFVTICTLQRQCILGEIVEGEMMLSTLGCVIEECWEVIPDHFPHVNLDAFIIMPNHLHGIVLIEDSAQPSVEAFARPAAGSLATIMRSFKSAATTKINRIRQTPGQGVWQRNYYEHVIRNQTDLDRIRTYIMAKLARWEEDGEYS